MKIIQTYSSKIGAVALNIYESPPETIYDYFQFRTENQKNFLFVGDRGYLNLVFFKESQNCIARAFRHLYLLFKVTIQPQRQPLQKIEASFLPLTHSSCKTQEKVDDFFCQTRAEKQVVWKGRSVQVLYPDNPTIETHFLLATQMHRDSFKEIAKEEFIEVIEVAKRITKLFEGEAHFLCKTGAEAGQTVPHFHFHLMIRKNEQELLYGKMKIARNILLSWLPYFSARLKGEALLQKVSFFRKKFESLN